ncbi:MAG TPA: hypothetical protein VLF95_06300, partial [Vicinamibacteria bacterium]|nr:hypothetical protein [Vicinamibacteria bacterium]
ELVALTAAARRARASLDEGHYTDALRVAQDLPAKVRAAADAAAAARQKQVAAWNEVSASLPALVEAIAVRVAEAAATKTLPKGLDEARFAAARADLESVTQGWSEATAAFQGGDVPRAVRTALDVEAKAGTLAATLGLAPAPVAAAPVP